MIFRAIAQNDYVLVSSSDLQTAVRKIVSINPFQEERFKEKRFKKRFKQPQPSCLSVARF
jgi:hypothetical protein